MATPTPTPDFANPPLVPTPPEDRVDFLGLTVKLRGLTLYLQKFAVWITQQLHRAAWVLRYGGLHIQAPLAAASVSNIYTAPFSLGLTAERFIAGQIAGWTYTNGTVGSAQYTLLLPNSPIFATLTDTEKVAVAQNKVIQVGSGPFPALFDWVMEAAS